MIKEERALAAVPPRGLLRDYVEYCSLVTDSNAAFAIAGGLILLSHTLPSTASFPTSAQPLRGNMYALIVGPSTKSRKSTAVKMASSLLAEAGVGVIGVQPGSHEALNDSLHTCQRQTIFYEEFGNFLDQTVGRGYLRPIKTSYTNLYDCPLNYGRALVKNANKGNVDNPRLSLFAAVNLDYLEEYSNEADWTGGFFARFFVIHAQREREIILQKKSPEFDARRKALVERLVLFGGVETSFKECGGWTPEAEEMYVHWVREKGKQVEKARVAVQACVERGFSMAQKVCLLLAWDSGKARSEEGWLVSADEMQYAIRIMDLHVDSALDIGDLFATTRFQKDSRKVMRRIIQAAPKPVTKAEILRDTEIGNYRYTNDVVLTLLLQKRIKSFLAENIVDHEGRPETCYELPDTAVVTGDDANVIPLFKRIPVLDDGYGPRGPELSAEEKAAEPQPTPDEKMSVWPPLLDE